MLKLPLYFTGRPSNTNGWGVCNTQMLKELSKLTRVEYLDDKNPKFSATNLPGHVFSPLGGFQLEPIVPTRGRFNYGYTFFENELNEQTVRNSKLLDVVFAGCTWCRDRLAEKEIPSVVLIQGVEGALFHPMPPKPPAKLFTIFSGGKFEYRKGQDLVLRAIKELQAKYADIVLVNAWFNIWPFSMASMAQSKFIKFEAMGKTWEDFMGHIYKINEIPASRIVTLPLLPQANMPQIYHRTDLGVFPNRCEGGTNLVMMEYMACGKPVVGTYGTGHTDVLTEANSYMLKDLNPVELHENGRLSARWVEPRLEDLVERIEYAYLHREETSQKALQAAQDMKGWTWEKAARVVLDEMRRKEEKQGR